MTKKKGGVEYHQQQNYKFLSVSLSRSHGGLNVTEQIILEMLDAALTGMYGVIGGAIPYDLVFFGEESRTAIIRCKQRDQARICAATSFLTSYKGSSFQLQVLECSPSVEPSGNLQG
ncbi:hypothetical protein R1flu_007328 [Riccia fluitans]|uniref:Ribonucleases P/MRP subunit Pop8-like domain-containing protein n=1 Tax=Riccia fluitans TaxID=41844 RepID=A0ABD1YZN6_9MARC